MTNTTSRSLLLLFILLCVATIARSQTTVTGKITDANGAAIAGVSIIEKGTANGTSSSTDGSYKLALETSDATLILSIIGFATLEVNVNSRSVVDVSMIEDTKMLSEVLVVGTRNANRSSIETPVAVDVIDLKQLATVSGQLDINQLLQVVAPSFNSNRQSGADGADHIDPASLRGLGPDQTLVLVNGKRRHQSSLVNIFGSRGRGNTGTDLNAIPVASIERIEILRDGAAAQYGSDAIAGVINIVLKSSVNEVTGSISVGARNAHAPNGSGPVDDGSGTYPITSLYSNRKKGYDGQNYQVNFNYGVKVGDKGYINVTTDFLKKQNTYRAGDAVKSPDAYGVRHGYGDAGIDQFSLMVNSSIPISPYTSFYAFGGFSNKATDAYAYTRSPGSARNVVQIYPDGFDPHITSNISDKSISAGVKTKIGEWDVDINNTFGQNKFHFIIDKTLNATLLQKSPTRFDAGGFQLSQNTSGIYFSRYFKNSLEGINLAFGSEYRIDNYRIVAGEEGSYRNYGVTGIADLNTGIISQTDTLYFRDTNGALILDDDNNPQHRPSGSQGFPGFQPSNEINANRQNLGLYVDGEFNITKSFMVATAARYENYSDFGNTLNGKLATRLEVAPGIALRGSISSGFRAPSLAQIYYNTKYTSVSGGQITDELIASNNSPVTRALGIDKLKQEKSINGSVGLTLQRGGFTVTVDGYYIKIKDRILLTGNFTDGDATIGNDLKAIGVSSARFFTNALDTKTLGLDAVVSYQLDLGGNPFKISFVGNYNHMTAGDPHYSAALGNDKKDTFFDLREKYFLLASAPRSKENLTFDYKLKRVNFNLRFVRYGEVQIVNYLYYNGDATPGQYISTFNPQVTVDLSAAINLTRNLMLTVGSSNLTNRYPSRMVDPNYTETGGYWEAVQMGFSGAYYFAKVGFKF